MHAAFNCDTTKSPRGNCSYCTSNSANSLVTMRQAYSHLMDISVDCIHQLVLFLLTASLLPMLLVGSRSMHISLVYVTSHNYAEMQALLANRLTKKLIAPPLPQCYISFYDVTSKLSYNV